MNKEIRNKKITPLLMSEVMIRAYRENRKCQTRRLRGLEEVNENPDDWEFLAWAFNEYKEKRYLFVNKKLGKTIDIKCPYGQAGDGLIFKESFLLPSHISGIPKNPVPVWYCADGSPTWGSWGKKNPSLFMPFWAIRNYPDILNIQAMRLNDIDEGDILEEGIERDPDGDPKKLFSKFTDLWDSLNGKKYLAWQNPWVWRILFEDYEFTFGDYEAELYHYQEAR